MRRLLPVLEQILTTTGSDTLPGTHQCERGVRTGPAITSELSETAARAIVRMQSEIRQSQNTMEFSSVAWLVSRGLVSVAELRAMGGLITTHGDVRTGVAVGQTRGHAAIAAATFMLDCSGTPPSDPAAARPARYVSHSVVNSLSDCSFSASTKRTNRPLEAPGL